MEGQEVGEGVALLFSFGRAIDDPGSVGGGHESSSGCVFGTKSGSGDEERSLAKGKKDNVQNTISQHIIQ